MLSDEAVRAAIRARLPPYDYGDDCDDDDAIHADALCALAGPNPVSDIITMLADDEDVVRRVALQHFAQLNPNAFSAQHVGAIVAMLTDTEEDVCRTALNALSRLSAEDLSAHVGAIVKKLEDKYLRIETLSVMAQFDPATLLERADAVIALLTDSDCSVRCEALSVLSQLDPEALSTHAGAVAERLADSQSFVRRQAMRTLARLVPAALLAHANAVVTLLADEDKYMRCEALRTIARLAPATLLVHEDKKIVALQASEDREVRDWARRIITARYAPGGAGARAAEEDFERASKRAKV